jgi:hypothetical protein
MIQIRPVSPARCACLSCRCDAHYCLKGPRPSAVARQASVPQLRNGSLGVLCGFSAAGYESCRALATLDICLTPRCYCSTASED